MLFYRQKGFMLEQVAEELTAQVQAYLDEEGFRPVKCCQHDGRHKTTWQKGNLSHSCTIVETTQDFEHDCVPEPSQSIPVRFKRDGSCEERK